jgi:hypothetical protein
VRSACSLRLALAIGTPLGVYYDGAIERLDVEENWKDTGALVLSLGRLRVIAEES